MRSREGRPVRYRARVEYDGTDFAGFQVQPGTTDGPGGARRRRWPTSAVASDSRSTGPDGRTPECTPTGQVIAFTYAGRLDGDGPRSGAQRVCFRRMSRSATFDGQPAGFHPRYAARYREYRYTVWNGPRSPLRERTALWVRTRTGHRRHGTSRSEPSSADTTSVRSEAPIRSRSGTSMTFGSEAGWAPGDDRCPRRRLPSRDGPAHGRRPSRRREGDN